MNQDDIFVIKTLTKNQYLLWKKKIITKIIYTKPRSAIKPMTLIKEKHKLLVQTEK